MTTLSPARATRINGHPRNCRCPGCTKAEYRYKQLRLAAIHNGTWTGMADAAPFLRILADHVDAGWNPRQISYVTDLTYEYTRTLLGINREPQPREIRPATARAITGLIGADRLDPRVPDDALVNAAGSVRRVLALRALRWPVQTLQGRYGTALHPPARDRTTARYARTVRRVYDDLSGTPGPSAKVAALAARNGWAPPLAWEFVDIDDPRAVPDPCTRARGQRRPAELLEDIEFVMRTTGASLSAAAARVGVSRDTLWKAQKAVAA